MEPIIIFPLKKVFVQPPLYKDIEPTTGTKVPLPTWNKLFIKIRDEYYPEVDTT
jgi:hypothetical protein